MSRSKTRATKHWELRSDKPKRVPRAMTLDDFRRQAQHSINEIKERAQVMNAADAKKFKALVYWMMADELGLVPHDDKTIDPLRENETNDTKPTRRWAERVTIEFGQHKGTLVSELPDSYTEWLLGQESPFFREVQDAIRLLNGTKG